MLLMNEKALEVGPGLILMLLMVTYIEFVVLFLLIIPFAAYVNLKEGVSASMMLKELVWEIVGLTLMHLRVMVTYIEFVVVFL